MTRSFRAGLVLCTAGALVGAPRPSEACGGFFCNNVPIEQAGEKVLFVLDGSHVTAHIQIQYQGPSEEFSWVVPVTAIPELGVGTDEIFPILDGQTRPYVVREYSERNCDGYYRYWGPEDAADGSDADSDADGDGDGGVNVLQSSVVGPFETVTLASDDPQALLDWLDENGYVIPDTAGPIIAAYVEADAYFVGLKLVKDADTGDLQPIVLSMDVGEGCVPLRLTAIAATPNMPVYVWVLGNGRGYSTNFRDVELNDVLLHHPAGYGGGRGYYGYGYGDPYVDFVTAAVDAAGGRGFVTDFAGASWPLLSAIDADRYDTSRIAGLSDPQAVMDELRRQRFTASQMLIGILEEFMPPPAGVESRDFYNCPSCHDLESYTFDAAGLAGALEDRIAGPLREISSEVARHTHLTRLFTTISPDEMTEDPFFAVRSDLPLVDRERWASQVRDCRSTDAYGDDYFEIETENGHRFCADVDGSDAPPVPLYERIVQYTADGVDVIDDRGAEIDAALHCPGDVGGDADGDGDSDGDGDGDGDSDGAERPPSGGEGSLCVAAPGIPGVASAAAIAAAILSLVVRRRRR